MPDEIVRPRARVLEVHDGDTYVVLIDTKRNRFRSGALSIKLRLRDYSCRELRQPAGNGLVSGEEATLIATQLLFGAKEILVELQGKDSMGRDVCWVWVDGKSLGAELMARGAAGQYAKEG